MTSVGPIEATENEARKWVQAISFSWMVDRPTLDSVIKDVGQKIAETFPVDDPTVADAAASWKQTHGLDEAASSDLLLARQAVFHAFLKLTLYTVYRIERGDLASLESPYIRRRLTDAYAKTNDEAFAENVLDELLWTRADAGVLEPLLDARHLLVNATNPTERIGRLFETVIPQSSRRKLGQFRTPKSVAETMSRWAIRSATDTVLDPGVGAGMLAATAYRAKHRHRGTPQATDIYGIDTSSLAVTMAATALKLVHAKGTPQLVTGDFLRSEAPGATFDSISGALLPRFDTIVANPPYSRHQELNDDAKVQMNQRAEAKAGITFSKRSPLSVYFVIHAVQLLKPGGRMAVLMPAEFLETKYGEPLKQFLLEQCRIRAFIRQNRDSPLFDDAETTSCIILLEKKPANGEKTAFFELTEWPKSEQLLATISDGTNGDTSVKHVSSIDQATLDATQKWTRYFSPESVAPTVALDHPYIKPLQKIASVKRGISTGANDYFCLSQEEITTWGLNPEADYLVPLVRTPRNTPHYNCSPDDWQTWKQNGKEAWLLYLVDHDREPSRDPALDQYLQHGRDSGITDGYVTQNRTPWYAVDERPPAPILAMYMSSQGIRFIHNTAGVRSLNNLHTIYPKGYSTTQHKALLAYLNSGLAETFIKHRGRAYAKGLKKVEPGALKELSVLDPAALPQHQVTELATRFEELCRASRTSNNTATVIEEIDEYLESLLEDSRGD